MKSSDYSYTLYKLIVLYALSRVEHPLTKSQIADFILTRDYTDYLTLQTVFSQLADAGFTQEKQIRNRTQLMLTKEGQNTLQLFSNELTAEIRHDIDEYLTEHAASLKNTAAVTSDYHLAADGG